jgi:hypothetical protein
MESGDRRGWFRSGLSGGDLYSDRIGLKVGRFWRKRGLWCLPFFSVA